MATYSTNIYDIYDYKVANRNGKNCNKNDIRIYKFSSKWNIERHIPVLYCIKRLLVCNIIHQNKAHCTTVVCSSYCPIPLLSSSILTANIQLTLAQLPVKYFNTTHLNYRASDLPNKSFENIVIIHCFLPRDNTMLAWYVLQYKTEILLQLKTNRKSHVSYRMAPISMTLSDSECHFSCF